MTSHQQRISAKRIATPDFDAVLSAGDAAFAAANLRMSPAMESAILQSPRSADIVYDLAAHPEIAIQLARKYFDLPVTAAPVVQDLLESRLAAASSGPAVVTRSVSQAKPVNKPVTGVAAATGADEPPGDDATDAQHEAYWAKVRSARRYR